MGTSNPVTLRQIAATRAADGLAALIEQTLAEAKRGADLSQVLVDQLGGPAILPAPETPEAPPEVTDA